MASWASLLVMGLCLFASNGNGSRVGLTRGDGGESCGPLGKRCPLTCNNVTSLCECPDPSDIGSGFTQCSANTTLRVEVANDPSVRRDGDKRATPLAIPCRYLLNHVKTKYRIKNQTSGIYSDVGSCEFITHAFHNKWKGKFYVAGFDVAMKLNKSGTMAKRSFRIQGKGDNGSYTFILNQTNDMFLPQGPWKNDYSYGYDVKFGLVTVFVDAKNFARAITFACGMDIYFRPYDISLGSKQIRTPFISSNARADFEPEFKSLEKALIPPVGNDGSPTLFPGLDMEQTLLVRALNSSAAQNSPNPNAQCSMTGKKLVECRQRVLALTLTRCSFILKRPRFVNCYDPTESGEKIMELFNLCIDVYCSGTISCQTVIDKIILSKCHTINPPYPDVTDFVNGTLCPR